MFWDFLQKKIGPLVCIAVGIGLVPLQAHTVKEDHSLNKTLKSPTPKDLPQLFQESLDITIHNGVTFLLSTQNANGSWGDATQTLSVNLLCPEPAGHKAFQSAVTSLCVIGLTISSNTPEVQKSLDKAEQYLLSELPKIRRTSEQTVLNFWTHAYGIRALCALSLRYSPESESYQKLKDECAHQIQLLCQASYAAGGWGYYEFEQTRSVPESQSTSFCTGTALIALHQAKKIFNLDANEKIVRRSVRFLHKQKTPHGTYVYSLDHIHSPQDNINRYCGSLARIQSCNLALYLYHSPEINLSVVENGLNWLWAQGGWLNQARKRPVPHEGFAQNAGYFFYYGYFYASEAIDTLDKKRQKYHYPYLALTLSSLQEKDGSWWDFPIYNYHKPYGTAYALYALGLARKSLYSDLNNSEEVI